MESENQMSDLKKFSIESEISSVLLLEAYVDTVSKDSDGEDQLPGWYCFNSFEYEDKINMDELKKLIRGGGWRLVKETRQIVLPNL